MTESCAGCRFYKAGPSYTTPATPTQPAVTTPAMSGTCRITPPTLLVMRAGNVTALWPTVEATDWCGKHEGSGS